MNVRTAFYERTLETLQIYWELVRVIVPVAILAEVLQRLGFIRAISPVFEPVMALVGLPPELAFAWLTALLVGLWGGVITVFSLTPVSALSTADMTVFSMLVLVAHAIPIEQQIIQRAGPGYVITSVLRVLGAFVFAFLLHQLFSVTGWLSTPLKPTWLPMQEAGDWRAFLWSTGNTLVMMLVVLFLLSWLIELLKAFGAMTRLNNCLAPFFKLAHIDAPTVPFASIGIFLGISYGAGLLIRESRTGDANPRQIFLACVLMGFAHSIVEDTLVVVALGADFSSVFFGRLAFAIVATMLIAKILQVTTDGVFYKLLFQKLNRPSEGTLVESN